MALAIDYGLNGAEAFVSKTARMTSSVKALNGAWSKYQKTVTGGPSKLLGGAKALGGGGGGGIIQNAAVFFTVGKIMERLMTDRMKSWFASLVRSDVEKYKNIAKSLRDIAKPLTDKIAYNSRLMYDSFKLSASVLKDTIKENYSDAMTGLSRLGRRGKLFSRAAGIKLFGRGPAMKLGKFLTAKRSLSGLGTKLFRKLPGSVRLAVAEGTIIAKVAGRMFGPIVKNLIKGGMNLLTKTPLSLLVAGPLFFAMLDSRVSEWLDKKITSVVKSITKAASSAASGIGNLWDGFKLNLAMITNNPYYANSQFNQEKAAQAITPQQQQNFMTEERLKALEEGNEVIIKVEMERMKKFFESENAKRAKEIEGVQSMMMKQGRL